MAQYLPYIPETLPEPALYKPDFNFYDKMLQRKQSLFEQGASKVKSAYSSVLNAQLSNKNNIPLRDQYIKDAQEKLVKLSSSDLSLMENVNAAEGIWALSAYRSGVQVGGIHVNDSILNIHGSGGTEVRLSTSGNATWNGNVLATQTWVQAQGYLTSETDSQELEWNQAEKLLTISNGNTVDLSQMASVSDIEDAGFITAESDTLATVTGRGATTANAITVGGATINGIWQTTISTEGGWSKLSFVASNAWGDGTTYGVLGAGGGAEPGVMTYNQHATWVGESSGAGVRMGRSGGVASGAWYQVATMGGDEFMIAKNAQWSNGGLKITAGGELQHGSGNKLWHAGNDGAGSGLDADLLDGNHASAFATRQDGARYTTDFNTILSSGFFNAEGTPANAPDDYGQLIVAKGNDTALQIFGGYNSDALYFRGWGYGPEADGFYPWRKVWHNGDFTSTNISNWNTAYGWGNHASAGYQSASTAITTSNIGSQNVNYAEYTNRTYRGIIEDTRAAQRTPNGYDDYRVSWEFTSQITGISDWHSVMTMQGWHDGYAAWQIIGPSSTTAHENWYLRSGNTTTWNTLRRIWHNGDFTSTNISNWNTAYGWGNHSGLYLSLTGGGSVTGRTDFKELGVKADGSDTVAENGFFRWTNSAEDQQILTQLNGENGLAFWSYVGSWSNIATLSQSGDFTVAGTLTEQSSIRYKENIVDLEPVTDKVYALRPVRYNKIGTETQEIGLIAEEVAELFPEVVHYNDEGQPESLNYTRLSVLLLQTVKELSERIQKLENK